MTPVEYQAFKFYSKSNTAYEKEQEFNELFKSVLHEREKGKFY